MCVCSPETHILGLCAKTIFCVAQKKVIYQMCDCSPETHFLKIVHTTLKLRPHLPPSAGAIPNPPETSLEKVSQSTFLGLFRHILSKKCISSPESHILKIVRTTLKLGLHHPPSVGRVPRHSETCFEQVCKSASTGSFTHILGKKCVYNSKSNIFKSVQITPKLCLHLPPSGGGVPRHSETCLDKVG